MKSKILFLALASCLSVPHYANVVEQITDSANASLPVKDFGLSTDGLFNYKTFCVEAPKEGDYYTQFWLLPARYADNTYTPFFIYVNGKYADRITVNSSNWQTAEPDGDGRLHLTEGTNYIAVATFAPDAPDVETIKVAEYFQDAVISSLAYDEYLAKAMKNNNPSPLAGPQKSYQYFDNVHLVYSFYKRYYLKQNRALIIETSSKIPHDVDVIFYGTSNIKLPELEAPVFYEVPFDTTLPKRISINPVEKEKFIFKTDAINMQGYNWKGISEHSKKAGMQTLRLEMWAPEAGHYLIRFRSRGNEQAGTINVTINGRYYFDSVPVNYVYKDVVFNSDNSEYYASTITEVADNVDPILFIHGNDGDRVVAFNDDVIDEYADENKYDSYIRQKFRIPTTRISLSNMNSLIPDNIYTTLIAGSVDEYSRKPKKAGTAAASSPEEKHSGIEISNIATNDSPIVISSNKPITKVSVYSLIGRLLYSGSFDSCKVELSTSAMNLPGAGIFIVSVSTDDETSSKKVLIK